MFNQSPIETLGSYAIAFAAGAVSVVLVAAYGQWMKQRGSWSASHPQAMAE